MGEAMDSAPIHSPARKPAPLLPGGDVRDGSLVFVVAVLCFLACLTAIAALAANRAAEGWRSQLSGSATVIVRAKGDETPDAAAARAAETLSGVKGVGQASALEKEKAAALLEPWLGKDGVPEDLPIPRLVTVDLDPKGPASAESLDKALKAARVVVHGGVHALWMKDIMGAGRMAEAAALAVTALMAAAAAAVIAFATRAGLAARRDVVEVLHLTGAEDGFIAGLFQARFARMAALAGLIGAGGAMLVAGLARGLGGGEGLTPVLPVAWTDLLVPLPCPIAAALVAALAARAVALKLLRDMT